MAELSLYSRLEYLPQLSHLLEVNLFVKRDDLLPMTGGGNKVRKVGQIIDEIKGTGSNALVTTGGLQSNHARVVALYSARNGWPATLVLHGDPTDATHSTGNLLLMKLAGATVLVVQPSEIAETMDSAMQQLSDAGYHPYEIPGGAHSVTGAVAYVQAVEEVRAQWEHYERGPLDHVILASGTGTTQAGIVVGLQQMGWHTSVIGISIARRNPRGRNIVEAACRELVKYLKIDRLSSKIDFRDQWIGKGYGITNEQVLESIRLAAEEEGLILDPTYTGKAFTALLDLVRVGEIRKGANVLFWHTGGIMNLMASVYLRDAIS